ncbi:MAG: TonB-dependent receptor [Bacteroidota bacterium]
MIRYIKIPIVFLLFMMADISFSQDKASVFGVVKNEEGGVIEYANISVLGYAGGVATDMRGKYELTVPAVTELTLAISFVGYEKQMFRVFLQAGQRKELNIFMKLSAEQLPDLEIVDKQIRHTNLQRLSPKVATEIPTLTGGVEDILKTLPGVTSNNELSSQYSVRGGNFDENLVYVNGIEIYRPFLIRSGQQEGLSFVNSALVSSILFSAGGFESKYGDKMSSVLDIQYKKPVAFAGSFQASLLGAQAHVEGISKNRKFTYLTGVRYKSNSYILKGLETQGDYKPNFADIQALFSYKLSDKLELSLLGNYARNSYNVIPSSRQTEFGTISEAYRLNIYFEGQELDRFENYMAALSLDYYPQDNLKLQFIGSGFETRESETFDILGEYYIGRLENQIGEEQFGEVVESQGVGGFLDHARNYLTASVFNLEHKGYLDLSKHYLQWGIRYQHEIIDDQLNEWELIDSAGYTIPEPPFTVGDPAPIYNPQLSMYSLYRADTSFNSNRFSAFIQNSWNFHIGTANAYLIAGIRASYWDVNKQFLLSPRATLSIKPLWEEDILFRLSAGYYQQPPFYRELRNLQGDINPNVRAQKSIHFVAGMDWDFMAWNRPFKFVTEAYYKILSDLVPYTVDNVRIRYFGDNMSNGYAYGLDMKVNGEFIKGVDSWFSLSLLQTQEDIEGDNFWEYYNEAGEVIIPGYTEDPVVADSVQVFPGYIPRPTDQRLHFALFFQDYIPGNPTWKMHIKLLLGTRMPFGPPNSPKYEHVYRTPPYRRVDIGFSKQLIGGYSSFGPKNPLKHIQSAWISLEVFNLFQIHNTISYIWVKDKNGREYAVPNFLTPRLFNLRFAVNF